MARRNQIMRTAGRGKRSRSRTHHWVVGAQEGPASRAVCKLCQAVQQFRNAADDSVKDGGGRKAG